MKQIKTILFAFGCSFLLSGTKAFAQVERLPDEASYPVFQELAGVESPAVLLSGRDALRSGRRPARRSSRRIHGSASHLWRDRDHEDRKSVV